MRRERSCHDIPLKDSSSIYNLQRRVRILREQVQRRDLHLELLRRKLAIIEDGARGKCVLQVCGKNGTEFSLINIYVVLLRKFNLMVFSITCEKCEFFSLENHLRV